MAAHLAFAAVFGVSEAVTHRAGLLLAYELGRDGGGPVSVATMLQRLDLDPDETALRLMLADPIDAVTRLTRMIARFTIDGEYAADAAAAARAALTYAGRVVDNAQLHPEIALLFKLFGALRRRR